MVKGGRRNWEAGKKKMKGRGERGVREEKSLEIVE